MTLQPASCHLWKWNGHSRCVEFDVDRMDEQMREVERAYKVIVSEEYLKDTFGIPDGSDPLAVAQKHHFELETIAMSRVEAGEHDEDDVIRIG
jgi:hypothetical protein